MLEYIGIKSFFVKSGFTLWVSFFFHFLLCFSDTIHPEKQDFLQVQIDSNKLPRFLSRYCKTHDTQIDQRAHKDLMSCSIVHTNHEYENHDLVHLSALRDIFYNSCKSLTFLFPYTGFSWRVRGAFFSQKESSPRKTKNQSVLLRKRAANQLTIGKKDL